MNNIPYGYDENGVRNGDGRWRGTISQEDIDRRIIGETRYYKEGIGCVYRDWETDRKSTRLNSSHSGESRMPSSA